MSYFHALSRGYAVRALVVPVTVLVVGVTILSAIPPAQAVVTVIGSTQAECETPAPGQPIGKWAQSGLGGAFACFYKTTNDTNVDEAFPTTPNPNDGTPSSRLYVRSSLSNNRRAYVGFTLPALPEGAVIQTARLWLQMGTQPDRNYSVHLVTESWSELTTTWTTQPASISTATNTIDTNPATYTTPGGLKWLVWDVQSDVQAYYNDTSANNFGWMVRDALEDSPTPPASSPAASFNSKETSTSSYPQLELLYVVGGNIQIVKATEGGDGSFDFTGDLGSFAISTSVNTGTETFNDLVPGTYTVSELAQPGWGLTGLTCQDPDNGSVANYFDGNVVIDLDSGETVTCIFSNTEFGQIIVDKITQPSGSGQSFDFTPTGWGAPFSLTDEATPHASELLMPGTYSVSEDSVAGWALSSATCSDGSTLDNIQLDPGEIVTCTFMNTQLGTIIVEKITDPSGSPQEFNFDAEGAGYNDFSLTDGESNEQLLVPGSYSLTEIPVPGWETSPTFPPECMSGLDVVPGPENITLHAGEVIICTFINTQTAPIDTTTTITNAAVLATTPSVVGETYSVDWEVTTSGGGTPTGLVSVSVGDDIFCTENALQGQCPVTSSTTGTKTVTVEYSGDSSFNPSSDAVTHQVNKAETTVEITNAAELASTPSQVGESYIVQWRVDPVSPGGGAPVTGSVTVTGGSQCSGEVASEGTGECTITSTEAGEKTLVATYAGDDNFNGSASGGVSHTVNKADQTIAFGPLADKVYGDADFTLSATASSGLVVSFSLVSGPAQLTGNSVGLIGAGEVVIRASQAGDDNYNPALDVDQAFTVSPKAIQVTADNQTKAEGEPDPALTYQITSGGTLVGSDEFAGTLSREPGEGLGVYQITQGSLNLNGNYVLSFVPGTLTITDGTPPEVVITNQPAALINTTTATFEFTAEPGALLECQLDDDEFEACASPVVLTGLGEGPHTFTVMATDAAGNSNTASADFTVDITAPALSVDPQVTNDTTPTVTGTTNDPADVLMTVNGNVYTATPVENTWSVEVTNALVSGAYDVVVTSTDAAGNVGNFSLPSALTIDTDAPSLTLNPIAPNSTSLSGTTDPDATVVVEILFDLYPAVVEPDGAWSAAVSPSTTGNLFVRVTATDSVGNESSVTSHLLIDTVPPVLTVTGANPQTIEVGSAYAELGAEASDDTDTAVEITIDSSAVNTAVVGSYSVTYTAVDDAGNSATETRTVNVVDTQAPAITLLGANPQEVELGSAYTELGATVADNYDTGLTATIDASAVDTAIVGSYEVTYNAADTSGNTALQVVRTVNVIEQLAPAITDEGATSSTTTSITITWTTDHPSTSRVIYDTVSHDVLGDAPNYGYAFSTEEEGTLVTAHSVTINDLDSGATYYLRTVSHGSPEAVSAEFTQTTGASIPRTGGGGGGGGGGSAPAPAPAPTGPVTQAAPQTSPQPQVLGVQSENVTAEELALVAGVDMNLARRLAGRMLLQVQKRGQAWYLEPLALKKYYLANGDAAYTALRTFGLGITNADLAKIPVGHETRFAMVDADSDGLPDKLEEALGTSSLKADTDGDGVSDADEVLKRGTNPLGAGKLVYETSLATRLKGRILLQVESRGEAWYVNPVDGKRYYMNTGEAAYQIMRYLSLGISDTDLRKIPVGDLNQVRVAALGIKP